VASRGLVAACIGAVTILAQLPAAAQDVMRAPPPGQADDTEQRPLTPPELVSFIEADYPPQAVADGLEGEVVLRIEIDEAGHVTRVDVAEPAGHGFDEAATDAVRRFEFRPARQGDQPIASRILYRYRFTLRVEEPSVPVLETATVSGLVTDMDEVAVPDALVRAILAAPPPGDGAASVPGEEDSSSDGAASEGVEARTGEDGRFRLGPLPHGSYNVLVEAAGFVPFRSIEPIEIAGDRELTIRLEREGAAFETVVRARRPSQELITRSMDARELERTPGTAGDPLRAIQSLPGMNRTPMGMGVLIVRGSSPGDSEVRLENVEIPLLYHFGGIYSVINPRLIQSIDFIPGNYPTRYGNAHGGIVEVRLRDLQQEPFVGWHGGGSIDVVDAEAELEGPIVDGLSFAVAARRSYIDAVAGWIMGYFDSVSLTTSPVFWDYQGIVQYRPSSVHDLRLVLYGSDDQLAIVSQEPPDSGQVVMGSISTHTNFHGGILRYRFRPEDHPLTLDVTFAAGRWSTRSGIADIASLSVDEWDFEIRPELSVRAGRWGRITIGANFFIDDGEWQLTIPDLTTTGCVYDIYARPWEQYRSFNPMVYVEAELRPVERFRITAGLNFDVDGWGSLYALEPRLWLRYEVVDGTAIEGGVGSFHQSPGFIESDTYFGNPGLRMERSVQYSLGLSQRIYEPLTLTVTGFYKWMDQLAVASDRVVEQDGERVPIRYENLGVGRVYGLEVLLRHEPTRWLFGWISYTLMRSERRDTPDEPWELFAFDQTHILTIVAGVSLPHGWEIGLRFQLTSGRPFTPFVGSIYTADCDDYTGIPGEPGSERLPLFHQLDLRIEKVWTVRRVARINLYLDVQNVYYSRNVEAYFYSYDFSQRYPITGLPIIPNLGLGVEF